MHACSVVLFHSTMQMYTTQKHLVQSSSTQPCRCIPHRNTWCSPLPLNHADVYHTEILGAVLFHSTMQMYTTQKHLVQSSSTQPCRCLPHRNTWCSPLPLNHADVYHTETLGAVLFHSTMQMYTTQKHLVQSSSTQPCRCIPHRNTWCSPLPLNHADVYHTETLGVVLFHSTMQMYTTQKHLVQPSSTQPCRCIPHRNTWCSPLPLNHADVYHTETLGVVLFHSTMQMYTTQKHLVQSSSTQQCRCIPHRNTWCSPLPLNHADVYHTETLGAVLFHSTMQMYTTQKHLVQSSSTQPCRCIPHRNTWCSPLPLNHADVYHTETLGVVIFHSTMQMYTIQKHLVQSSSTQPCRCIPHRNTWCSPLPLNHADVYHTETLGAVLFHSTMQMYTTQKHLVEWIFHSHQVFQCGIHLHG